MPSKQPSSQPTGAPSRKLSIKPTVDPSRMPSAKLTRQPTQNPSKLLQFSSSPSVTVYSSYPSVPSTNIISFASNTVVETKYSSLFLLNIVYMIGAACIVFMLVIVGCIICRKIVLEYSSSSKNARCLEIKKFSKSKSLSKGHSVDCDVEDFFRYPVL